MSGLYCVAPTDIILLFLIYINIQCHLGSIYLYLSVVGENMTSNGVCLGECRAQCPLNCFHLSFSQFQKYLYQGFTSGSADSRAKTFSILKSKARLTDSYMHLYI